MLVHGQSEVIGKRAHDHIEGHGTREVDKGEGDFLDRGQENVEAPVCSTWQSTDPHELLLAMSKGRRDVAGLGQETHCCREGRRIVRAEQGVNVATLTCSTSVRAHDGRRIGDRSSKKGFVANHFRPRNLEQKLLVVPQADGLGGREKLRIGGRCGSKLGEAGQPCGREVFGLLDADAIAVLEDRKALGAVDGLDLFGGG